MEIKLEKVTEKEKNTLYNLLQFALYDGSFYIDNKVNQNGEFEYRYFEDYFTDKTRDKYFIKCGDSLAGFVLINENRRFNYSGKTIAEFLIMPQYRRMHIGYKAATMVFELYHGNWEVQPMENNPIATSFWNNTIFKYTNNHYEIKNNGEEEILIFNN